MRLIIVLLLSFGVKVAFAQMSVGGMPVSFDATVKERWISQMPLEAVSLSITQKMEEKSYQFSNSFTIPINTNLNLQNSGVWLEFPNGDRLWRVQINVSQAEGLILMYDKFHLPKGSKLFVYSPDEKQLLGAYTQRNNNKSNRFLTGVINGGSVIVEYYEPKLVHGQGTFQIFRVDALTQAMNESTSGIGFGKSARCNININCPQGENWQDVKRSVCRIMMVAQEGTFWCSGTLLNNTLANGKPYVLSGDHCVEGITPMYDLWRFDFNYESLTCQNPIQNPSTQSMLGCQLRSKWQDTDFLLVELFNNIPQTYNVFFSGWDARAQVPQQSALIHHPFADIKKITLENRTSIIFNAEKVWFKRDNINVYKTPIAHHFRLTYNNGGTFQGGSSGAGVFDGSKRLVAQLHGGVIDTLCRVSTAFAGRLALAWEGGGTPENRLKDWLDPNNSGVLFVDGIENPVMEKMFTLKGKINMSNGKAVNGVNLMLNNESVGTTDITGNYLIEELESGKTYTLKPVLDRNHRNGVSIFDVVSINKHILNVEPFESVYQWIAADVNNSKSISLFDLITVQKVILNIEPLFPNNTSWRFVNESARLASIGEFDFNFSEEAVLEAVDRDFTILFTAIKVGDTNNSADAENP